MSNITNIITLLSSSSVGRNYPHKYFIIFHKWESLQTIVIIVLIYKGVGTLRRMTIVLVVSDFE